MSKYFVAIISLAICGCGHRDAEFIIDGVGYYTSERCTRDTSWSEWCYHYGYNVWSGKFEYHYGLDHKSECLEYTTDTIKTE